MPAKHELSDQELKTTAPKASWRRRSGREGGLGEKEFSKTKAGCKGLPKYRQHTSYMSRSTLKELRNINLLHDGESTHEEVTPLISAI